MCRPIGVFSTFGARAQAVDYFTLMSTYSYYDVARPGHSHYNDYLMVKNAIQGGVPPSKLGCGIMSVSQKSNKSHWNASTFSKFVDWAEKEGIGAVDVWRNDIDVTWPVDATAPWMLATLDKYLATNL
eukprot:SAG11_NODE_675_length_7800_cov_6.380730_4_plen_128_part_00